jgi:hypothetical protein
MGHPQSDLSKPTGIALPRSSSRLQRTWAHCRVVTRIGPDRWNAAFEGPIYRPGAVLAPELLGGNPVVIECVGPVGTAPRGKPREVLWILWRYDWQQATWCELARAQAVNWEWAQVLRPAALRALEADRQMYDVLARGRHVAEEVMTLIERHLDPETRPVQQNTWTALYTRVAGRIVQDEG